MSIGYLAVDRLLDRRVCDRRQFFLTALASAGLTTALTGCGGSDGGTPEVYRSHLYRLGAAYNMYTRKHHQQPPADEKAFLEYIASLSESQRDKLQAEDIDAFFISPRTGEPYVVLYGEQAQKNVHGVIAYEQQQNPDGKRWLATSLGDVSAVDANEFQRLTTVSKNKRKKR